MSDWVWARPRRSTPAGGRWGSLAQRRAMIGEIIDVLDGVWSTEHFSYAGEHFQCTNMRVVPGPLQQPRPPFLIGGSGDRTLEQVARRADACNLLAGSPDDIRARNAFLDAACRAAGRAPDEVLRSFMGAVVLARSESQAHTRLRATMDDALIAGWLPGNMIFAGTPEQAVAHFQRLIAAGIQYVIVTLADTADHETVELLATEVIPALNR